MKEFSPNPISINLRQSRNQAERPAVPKVHERGDKVVVNGAKESLLSILRKYHCQCEKHTGDKLVMKFLTMNKIIASYDAPVWMFIFLRLNFEDPLFHEIVNEYVAKMHRKMNENESHQSQKYKTSKKRTLLKFIESAQYFLVDNINESVIEQSVSALYSKGKSRDNALQKIKAFSTKMNIQDDLTFLQSNCSFKGESQSSGTPALPLNQKQRLKPLETTSDNSEGNILPSPSRLENQSEETPLKPLEEYESGEQLFTEAKESYDLFDELIRFERSDSRLRGSY